MENRFEKIKTAVEVRDKFLAENPEYQSLQDEIDLMLSKIPTSDHHNRQVAIQSFMMNTWSKIIDASAQLNGAVATLNKDDSNIINLTKKKND